mmetsp:Transcript_43420/g.144588  ORF Transcript_43420/g.144588 Transcript_43420/m.144588 type:complete len:426 (-) Transcript_43420:874-2151(-)
MAWCWAASTGPASCGGSTSSPQDSSARALCSRSARPCAALTWLLRPPGPRLSRCWSPRGTWAARRRLGERSASGSGTPTPRSSQSECRRRRAAATCEHSCKTASAHLLRRAGTAARLATSPSPPSASSRCGSTSSCGRTLRTSSRPSTPATAPPASATSTETRAPSASRFGSPVTRSPSSTLTSRRGRRRWPSGTQTSPTSSGPCHSHRAARRGGPAWSYRTASTTAFCLGTSTTGSTSPSKWRRSTPCASPRRRCRTGRPRRRTAALAVRSAPLTRRRREAPQSGGRPTWSRSAACSRRTSSGARRRTGAAPTAFASRALALRRRTAGRRGLVGRASSRTSGTRRRRTATACSTAPSALAASLRSSIRRSRPSSRRTTRLEALLRLLGTPTSAREDTHSAVFTVSSPLYSHGAPITLHTTVLAP